MKEANQHWKSFIVFEVWLIVFEVWLGFSFIKKIPLRIPKCPVSSANEMLGCKLQLKLWIYFDSPECIFLNFAWWNISQLTETKASIFFNEVDELCCIQYRKLVAAMFQISRWQQTLASVNGIMHVSVPQAKGTELA